ncbi:MAG: hypothetical protein OEV60_09055 [Actinomycetota bacterium]|nr:hypothetical protein [Actinomycetota bacterium]
MVPSAYLRVYQPLDRFERAEQLHWERFLLHGPEIASIRPRYADRQTVGRLGVLAPADSDSADVLHVGGRTLISPRRMRMRVLAAMVSFREAQPIELWEQFVPKKDGRRAARDLARLRRRDPNAVSFCHQSPWHVPVRWFVLFRDEERELTEDPYGRWRLRYRTSTRRAIRRAEQAIGPLRRTDLGPIGDLILDLHQWMVQFDPDSIVELDYAELCDFQRWNELDDDHSAREVLEALQSLEAGEYPKAADVYQGVLARWAEVRTREILN